jgi:hypothetical protein
MSGHFQRSTTPKHKLYHATIHTCTTNNRNKTLKGLAALVVDVSMGSGEVALAVPHDLYLKYIHACSALDMEQWEQDVLAYFRRMKEKHPITWMRLLHNPNIAFMEKPQRLWGGSGGGIMSPREISAKYYVKVMEEAGYRFAWGEKK